VTVAGSRQVGETQVWGGKDASIATRNKEPVDVQATGIARHAADEVDPVTNKGHQRIEPGG